MESLSAYARQFLEMMQKPDVDHIDGLSPAISIEQKTTSKNPRSTVGTVTEIYDYLRLLFARVGVPYSPATGLPIESQTVQQMVDRVLALPEGTRLYLLAPIVRGRKGEYRKELAELQKKGFQRVKVNGQFYEIPDAPKLDKKYKHDIDVVVDRLVVRGDIASRLADSFETALELADGIAIAEFADKPLRAAPLRVQGQAGDAGPTPRGEGRGEGSTISTSQVGATAAQPHEGLRAPRERGQGHPPQQERDARAHHLLRPLRLPGLRLHHRRGRAAAVLVQRAGRRLPQVRRPRQRDALRGRAGGAGPGAQPEGRRRLSLVQDRQPLGLLRAGAGGAGQALQGVDGDAVGQAAQEGAGRHPLRHRGRAGGDRLPGRGRARTYKTNKPFEGVINNLARRFRETESDWVREELSRYQDSHPCDACDGYRLKPQALAVKIDALHIGQVDGHVDPRRQRTGSRSCRASSRAKQNEIAMRILKEIRERLQFLVDVGLDYLTLSRASGTLSGGESQRIRLASQIGSGLTGVLYVLDEPSIGLHQRDNAKLLETLKHLRDIGNTVIVVEHDEDAILTADYVVDIGPGAGIHGGHIVAQGTPQQVMDSPNSITGQYLTGARQIPMPKQRRQPNGKALTVVGARENNLKNVTASIPLGLLTCITGVSGGGKSTLLIDTIYKAVARRLNGAREHPGAHDKLEGLEHLDKVIDIDQSPIGRTPRSNPATYTGAFTPIREWYAGLPEAKARGYQPGRFSFNVKGGRCEACQGDGVIKIEMHFLPDVYVTCDVCKGKRYNRETLEVKFKDKSVADVLDMTVEEGAEFFKAVPSIRDKMETLARVGLGYIHIGQQATTLSGGEAQRIKLAKELSRRATGRTLYILDEPTTGLHFHDVAKLLEVLHELTDAGNTVVVIEHNLEVIKTADWVIDMGPEGGDGGGRVVAQGTPEDVARVKESYTGQYLRELLGRRPVGRGKREREAAE